MRSPSYALVGVGPLAGVAPYHDPNVDVIAEDPATILSITARRGRVADLQKQVAEVFGVPLPAEASRSGDEQLTVLSTRPHTWLVVKKELDFAWMETVATRLEGVASVSSQTGAYALLRVRGPSAQSLLMRGIFLDLDFPEFSPTGVAATLMGQFQVILWRAPEPHCFRMAVPRSVAADAWAWLLARARSMPPDAQRMPS
jgi:methylglutamate dehydrogenase subunit D